MKIYTFFIILSIFLISSCKTLDKSDKREIREEARQRRMDKNKI